MDFRRLVVFSLRHHDSMDDSAPDRPDRLPDDGPTREPPAAEASAARVPSGGTPGTGTSADAWSARPLADLLVAIQSPDPRESEQALRECLTRYLDRVYRWAFNVLRSVAGVTELSEEASDVAATVLGNLRHLARDFKPGRYDGSADAWLETVTKRLALRRKAKWTGFTRRDDPAHPRPDWKIKGRLMQRIDYLAEQIAAREDDIEREELMELQRRIEALLRSKRKSVRRMAEYAEFYIRGEDPEAIAAHFRVNVKTVGNWPARLRALLGKPPAVGTRSTPRHAEKHMQHAAEQNGRQEASRGEKRPTKRSTKQPAKQRARRLAATRETARVTAPTESLQEPPEATPDGTLA